MNVLHIGAGNLYGGVEKVLLTLARLGHLVPELKQHFAVCFRGKLEDELRQSGVSVHSLHEMHGRRPMSVLKNRRALRRLHKELQADAIVYHSLWSYDLLAMSGRSGSPIRALWMHDAFGRTGRLESFARFRKPDLILSNSHYTAQTAPFVYPDLMPRVLYYPIEFRTPVRDARTRAAIRAQFRTGDQDVVIIQSSRMEPWKGHQHHLNALSQLRDLPGWVLWIAGGAQREQEQKYLEGLKRQAEALGIAEKIRFLGHRDDVPTLLDSADIHCQPNLGPEPFGIAFVEAMMAQLPIATFRLGAAPELIGTSREDAYCGLLAEPGDVKELATVLRSLIMSRELRQRLGNCGPGRARQISDPNLRLRDLFSNLSDHPNQIEVR